MLNITVTGDQAIIARLQSMPSAMHAALLRKVTALALKLEAHVKNDKLSGQVLKVKSGALRRSIQSKVEDSATGVTGSVFSSGDVKYAGIHEFGGTTKAHVIEAVNGKALAFQSGGKQVFFTRVNHPGSVMPERSFLRSSLKDMKEEIETGIKEAIMQSVKL